MYPQSMQLTAIQSYIQLTHDTDPFIAAISVTPMLCVHWQAKKASTSACNTIKYWHRLVHYKPSIQQTNIWSLSALT
jgi:hypothetical protein